MNSNKERIKELINELSVEANSEFKNMLASKDIDIIDYLLRIKDIVKPAQRDCNP